MMLFSYIEIGRRCIEKKRIVIIGAGRWDLRMYKRRNLKPKGWRRGMSGWREMVRCD